jgi:hypothetical protein
MMDDDECEAVCGMRIGMGNQSIKRKPAPVPLCPPQISHDLMRDQTPATMVGSYFDFSVLLYDSEKS